MSEAKIFGKSSGNKEGFMATLASQGREVKETKVRGRD